MRMRPDNPTRRPVRPIDSAARFARRIAIWLLTLLIRLTIAITLLLTLRWIVLRFRRVRIRPTPYATPPIGPDEIDTQRRRIVLSDLHLGGGDRRDDFCDDEALIAFLDHYVGREPTELILAGDTFEFLQISLPDVADDEWSQRAAARRLQAIMAAHAGVFAALRRFVQHTGNQLTVLIGNHDFELHYPAAKEALRETLGLPPDDPRLRFGISYHGGGVYIVHGNQFDRWNRFVNFASISEPFEVVRGTQLVKEVINELEEDPFPLAPLVDNIKPSSAFFWYLISLQRLRDPAARRFVTRGVIGFLQVTAWAPPHHLSSEPDEWLQRSPLIVLWPPIAALRRRRVARHQAIARQFGAAAEAVGDLPEMVDQVRDEARRQASREVAAFNDEIARDIALLARQPAYRDDRLFVCGHTHVARVIDLGNGRRYINVGTWTDVVFDVETMRRPRQRYPFLEITTGNDGAPHGRLLVWYGPDQPPQPWYDEEPPRQRRQSRVQWGK
ncbi:UDP-2,3-diacylglucosamine hydrolase [Chloroflexus islandicus]|uniref:UDP-2,3-diacylglucosamine hydrolase n=1 Tax=Chloroflexus islandicus TaxID=1707952 RepID=A0A178M6F1_9CHLR|nr:UDP-2,3-diacylglucosamine diphosphatase [Chloroflexus islandicus]OAN43628.1 UDP-2,3-diacylglucosamine hydrolase [Chloroflexus islandicus]